MTAQESLSTKESLLRAAKKVFARKGFNGATVKDIAEEAGVNVSLVSYHYDGKENLFKACIEELAQSRLASSEKFLKGPTSLEDMRVRLTLMTEEFFEYNQNEPDMNEIMHRECGVNNPLTDGIYRTVFFKAFTNIADFFRTAQKIGVLSSEVNAEDRTILFLGGLIHVVRTETMRQKLIGITLNDTEFRERITKSAVRMAMEGSSS
jgi:AcrR family transcriptional regulator